MDDSKIVYIILGVLLFTVLCLSFVYPLLKQIIHIHLTPTSHVSALPSHGQIEVVGNTGRASIPSPLTKTDCVLWQIVVQELFVTAKHARWFTIHNQVSGQPFVIEDLTGKIEIIPAGVNLLLRDERESSSMIFPMNEQTRQVVEEFGVETIDRKGNDKSLRIYEHIIKPGEKIYILGEIENRNGTITIANADNTLFIISDHSQRELLGKLYRDLAYRTIIIAFLTLKMRDALFG